MSISCKFLLTCACNMFFTMYEKKSHICFVLIYILLSSTMQHSFSQNKYKMYEKSYDFFIFSHICLVLINILLSVSINVHFHKINTNVWKVNMIFHFSFVITYSQFLFGRTIQSVSKRMVQSEHNFSKYEICSKSMCIWYHIKAE